MSEQAYTIVERTTRFDSNNRVYRYGASKAHYMHIFIKSDDAQQHCDLLNVAYSRKANPIYFYSYHDLRDIAGLTDTEILGLVQIGSGSIPEESVELVKKSWELVWAREGAVKPFSIEQVALHYPQSKGDTSIRAIEIETDNEAVSACP